MNPSQHLSQKLQRLSESATIRMAQLARNLSARGHDVISLSLGEPDFDTPAHIKEAAKRALDEGYTKYTPVPGLLPFREAIVRKFARDNDLHFDVNQIVVSNGAKQSIANLCLTLLDPGDEVIIFTPYWVSYYEIVRFAGGVPKPLKAGIESDFKVSAQQLEAAITDRTKIVLFSSPCNPTGSVYSHSELAAIAKVIGARDDIFVIADEIYEYINFTDQHISIGSFESVRDRTITVNGMSKGFAMTGWRLGYIGAPTWVAKACAKVQGQFTSGATAFGQMAAAYALEADMEPTQTMKRAFRRRRDRMIEWLGAIPDVEVNHPQGAFYIFPNVRALFGRSNGVITIKDANHLAELLLEHSHVATVSGSAFGDSECLRISYAASDERLKEAVSRIQSFLRDFR